MQVCQAMQAHGSNLAKAGRYLMLLAKVLKQHSKELDADFVAHTHIWFTTSDGSRWPPLGCGLLSSCTQATEFWASSLIRWEPSARKYVCSTSAIAQATLRDINSPVFSLVCPKLSMAWWSSMPLTTECALSSECCCAGCSDMENSASFPLANLRLSWMTSLRSRSTLHPLIAHCLLKRLLIVGGNALAVGNGTSQAGSYGALCCATCSWAREVLLLHGACAWSLADPLQAITVGAMALTRAYLLGFPPEEE